MPGSRRRRIYEGKDIDDPMIKSLAAAFGFLTVFPIPLKRTLLPGDMGKSMAFFPVVGVILGGILVLADKILLSIFPGSVADFILISLLALITGGVHLDGLADTFDGLYGGKTREEALSIMKDSRVGAMGVVALILVIGLKYTSLLSISSSIKYPSLILMPVLSRWSMVLMAYLSSYARPAGGTGRDFVETVSIYGLLIATVFAVVTSGALFQWKGVSIAGLIGGVTILWVIYFREKLGGVTGDILGAVNEVNEVIVLLSILILL